MLREIIWPKGQTRGYRIVRIASIVLGDLAYILDLYIAYLLGEGRVGIAFLFVALAITFGLTNNFAWTWVLEQMGKDKVKYGRGE